MTLGERIRRNRGTASQREFARLLGVTFAAVSGSTAKTSADLVEAWIALLRSSKFQQCFDGFLGSLRGDRRRYCALGLGAYACGVEPTVVNVFPPGSSEYASGWALAFDGCARVLSAEIKDKLGIDECDVGQIVAMNDEDNRSFEEIADWIEAEVLPRAKETGQ